MNKTAIFLLAGLSLPAAAEVFKCTGSFGKTVYQSKPCQTAVKEQQLDIKTDPAVEAEARVKLEALRSEMDARRTERQNREQRSQESTKRVDQVETPK